MQSAEAHVGVTVVLTSCGRRDLLVRTLNSFFRHNTYPIYEFLIVEDGQAENRAALEWHYKEHNVRWLATGERVGQLGAIDYAYRKVRTKYIFHCEDDWEFYAPGFIEKSLAVLEANPDVLQVWLRALDDTNRHPIMDLVLLAGKVPYRLLEPNFRTEEWGIWHGFSFNPGLRRRRDYELVGSFRELDPTGERKPFEVERFASEVYRRHGMLAAILSDNHGQGYVRHLGWGRRVEAAVEGPA